MKEQIKLMVTASGNGAKLDNSLKGFSFTLVDANDGFKPVSDSALWIAAELDNGKSENARAVKSGARLSDVVRSAVCLVSYSASAETKMNEDYKMSATLAALVSSTESLRATTDERAAELTIARGKLSSAELSARDEISRLAFNFGEKIEISGNRTKPNFGECWKWGERAGYFMTEDVTHALFITEHARQIAEARPGAKKLADDIEVAFGRVNNALDEMLTARVRLERARKEEERACVSFFGAFKELGTQVKIARGILEAARQKLTDGNKLSKDTPKRAEIIATLTEEVNKAKAALDGAIKAVNDFKSGNKAE